MGRMTGHEAVAHDFRRFMRMQEGVKRGCKRLIKMQESWYGKELIPFIQDLKSKGSIKDRKGALKAAKGTADKKVLSWLKGVSDEEYAQFYTRWIK